MKKKLNKWVLGLIILPFVGILVWILFGLFSYEDSSQQHAHGFNTKLPEANLSKDSAFDKLSFYSAAKQDSIQYADRLQLDPYRSKNEFFGGDRFELPVSSFYEPPKHSAAIHSVPASIDIEENKIKSVWEQRDTTLEAIQQLLDQLATVHQGNDSIVSRGETRTLVVSKKPEDYFGPTHSKKPSSFYGLMQSSTVSSRWIASLPAQVIQSGTVVKIQLLEDLQLPDCLLKAGSMIYGQASLQQERMQVLITSVPCIDRIVQTELQVYDLDGIKGVSAPSAHSKEVLSAAVDPAMQSLDLPIGFGSVTNKVAMAGMQTAKQLLAKKAKAIRIHVSSGYRVYLYQKE